MATSSTELRSTVFEVDDLAQAHELCYERGWTDGLPVIPPTEGSVARMLDYLGRDPQEVIGIIPPKNGIATLEKIAINCVMAGCLPQYLPVVLAALDAMAHPQFNLNGVETTQNPCEPLLIVGGPLVKELGFNYRDGVFGGASRANATIGRAIRLILWNIGGSVPGELAKSPLSQPGRYSFCIGEQQEGNPWPPMHTEQGLPAGANAVTVFAAHPPTHLHFGGTEGLVETVEDILVPLAEALSTIGTNQLLYLHQSLIVLGPEAAGFLARHGWSREDVRLFLFENARKRLGFMADKHHHFRNRGNTRWPRWIDQTNEDTMVPPVARPEDIYIVVTGGPKAAAICFGWHFSWAQTRAIQSV